MTRIRADYVFGTTDTALAIGDVTISSPALTRLPAVTGTDVAAITLHDPASGIYETVYVTAHTAAATTATISRAQEGSAARAWASGTAWLHGPTAKDLTDLAAADAALSSAKADKTTYKGAWDSGTTYAKNDTAENANTLWRAINPIAGTAPTDATMAIYVGGPGGSATYAYSGACEQITFTSAAAFSRIRTQFSAVDSVVWRVGLSATKPTDPKTVSWLCYADLTPNGTDTWAEGALNASLAVASGQVAWIVAVPNSTPTAGINWGGSTATGAATMDATTLTSANSGSTAWNAHGSDGLLAVQVEQVGAIPWEKVADLPVVPDTYTLATKTEVAAKADKTTYKGAWSSGATYTKNDTAENANALWRAEAPTTGTAPDGSVTDAFTGGPAPSNIIGGAPLQAQEVTFTAAQTFTKVRVATASGSTGIIRVGLTAARPGPTDTMTSINWLAYAEFSKAPQLSAYSSVQALNAPVTVAPGQSLWLVIHGGAANQVPLVNGTAVATVGAATLAAPPYYASAGAWTAQTGYNLCIQLDAPTYAWEKIADLPVVPDTSTLATKAELAAKADKTTYKGAWDSGTTYAKNDTAENANVLWRSLAAQTGTTPSTAAGYAYQGATAASSQGAYANWAIQPVTFLSSARLTRVSAMISGSGSGTFRVGLAASKSADPSATTFLGYADIVKGAGVQQVFEADLGTPVDVVAGTQYWIVVRRDTGSGTTGINTYDPAVSSLVGVTLQRSSAQYSTGAATAWNATPDDVYLRTKFSAAPTATWEKIADLPDTSTLATKTSYWGAWDSTKAYLPSDTVESGNVLWRAVSPATGTAPSDTATVVEYDGGPNTLGAASSACVYQPVTFTAAGTFTHARGAFTGAGTFRIGYSATEPTGKPNAVSWLAYADITTADGWSAPARLNTPLVVATGQKVWAVVVRASGSSLLRDVTGSFTGQGSVTLSGPLGYSADAATGWASDSSAQALNIQAVKTATAWEKVLDLPAAPDTSSFAPKTTYRGAWSSGTTYAKNDTAESANALWKAVNPITGTAPALPVDSYVGGPDTIGGGVGGAGATQQMTFASAATFSRIRVAQAQPGTARVGFSATKPTDTTAVTWLAYADLTHSGTGADYTEGTLNTPLSVTAGQSLWFVWVLTSGTVNTFTVTAPSSSAGTSGGVTVTTSSGLFYAPSAGAFSASGLSLVVNAQLILTTTNWEKVADLPVVPDTSGFATATALATKADKTTYRGAWASGTTYVANDTVENGDVLWRGVSPVTGTAPGATTQIGGPDTAGDFGANAARMQMTVASAVTLNRVRVKFSVNSAGGGMRVGFAAASAASPNSVSWLGYGDVAAAVPGQWAEVDLTAPVTLAAGQAVWVYAVPAYIRTGSGTSAAIANGAAGTAFVGGAAIVAGSVAYATAGAGSWTATSSDFALSIQGVQISQAWEKVADVPAARTRTTVTKTTASLADAAVESSTVNLATGFRVLKVATDRAARVRLYATAAQRDADVARAFGTDPTGDHGLLLDYQTTSGVLSAALSPVVDGASLEAVPSAAIPCSITNVSGAASPVAVTLTWQRTE